MDKLIFVQQPRVPVKKIVISFPAGIIDKGENARQAAKRELLEETGYQCKKIISVSSFLPKSAGLTNESTYQVQCIVDESSKQEQQEEETEDIKVFWATPEGFIKRVSGLDKSKYAIESDAWNFVSGIARRDRP